MRVSVFVCLCACMCVCEREGKFEFIAFVVEEALLLLYYCYCCLCIIHKLWAHTYEGDHSDVSQFAASTEQHVDTEASPYLPTPS